MLQMLKYNNNYKKLYAATLEPLSAMKKFLEKKIFLKKLNTEEIGSRSNTETEAIIEIIQGRPQIRMTFQ